MRRSVLQILSTSYSGSTLLGLLLDSQPGVRGLGEAIHLAQRSGYATCLRCQTSAAQCELGRTISERVFYSSLFDHYGRDALVLVDSSKSLQYSLLLHGVEPQFRHRCILLSKSPHEFAASWLGHHPSSSVQEAFRIYVQFYEEELDYLWGDCGFAPTHVVAVTYRNLTTSTDSVVRTLCQLAGLPGTPIANCRWWDTDSHLIGGNWLVNAQVTGFAEVLRRATPRDQKRYDGREHQIVYDESWRADPEFLGRCVAAYEAWGPRLTPLLQELGQRPLEELQEEVREERSARNGGREGDFEGERSGHASTDPATRRIAAS